MATKLAFACFTPNGWNQFAGPYSEHETGMMRDHVDSLERAGQFKREDMMIINGGRNARWIAVRRAALLFKKGKPAGKGAGA